MTEQSTSIQRDPTLFSTNHLIFLGMQNLGWNEEARNILAGRGEDTEVRFLGRYEVRCLKSGVGSSQMRFGGEQAQERKQASIGKCADCGCTTARTYNRYWQCKKCATAIQNAGSRKALAEFKTSQKAEAKPKPIQPAEIIPAHEPSYETALKEGAAPGAIRAAGDREVIQAMQAAYQNEKQNGPIAKAIQEVRNHAA